MIIESMTIHHFRCIEDCTIAMGPHIALVGPNGVGKSTVLAAVQFVLDPAFASDPDDANVGSPDAPLAVSMRFGHLTDGERETWGPLVGADGTMSLRREAVVAEGSRADSTWYGTAPRHEPFDDLFVAYESNKNVFRAKYREFVAANRDYPLPTVTRSEDGYKVLLDWQTANPGACVVKESVLDGRRVEADLGDAFRVVHVPAVQSASDMLFGRKSPLGELVEQMLMPSVAANPKLLEFEKRLRDEYRAFFPVDGPTELAAAEDLINRSLRDFAPGTAVRLNWDENDVPAIRPPQYQTMVVEDGVTNDVTLKGHGVQRAIVVSMLNALSEESAAHHPSEEGTSLAPTTVLLVEEGLWGSMEP